MGVSLSSQRGGLSAFCLATRPSRGPWNAKILGRLAPTEEMVFSKYLFRKRFPDALGLLIILPLAVSVVVFIVARVTAKILAPLFVGHIVIMDNHRGSKWS